MRTHLHYWLATLYLPKIGLRTINHLLTIFPSIEALFQASKKDWLAAGLSHDQVQALTEPDWQAVEQDLRWAEQSGHHIITKQDDDYPVLLREIHDAPMLLFIEGKLSCLSMPQIAIVGARNASAAGLENAEQFAYHLSLAGFAITSGLARGIDGAAHRGALRAQGATLAVYGTGLQRVYPATHRELAQKIASDGGALISEFPLQMGPLSNNFPRRNRIISGLSLGVLVVEAALKSGSMITVRYALEQGREVFAMPGSIHHPLARGCHQLIRQGAKLVDAASDILEEMGVLFTPQSEVILAKEQPLMPEYRQILDQIGHELTPLDVIICRSGLTAGQVSSILLIMELNGYVQSLAGGYVRRP